MRKKLLPTILLSVLAMFIGLVFVFPVYVMLITTLKPETSMFDMKLWPEVVTFENYVEVVTNFSFLNSVKNSLFIAVVATLLALFCQTLSAYAFSRLNFKGKNFMFILTLSTMMIPGCVLIIPNFLVVKFLGFGSSLWAVILIAIPSAYGVFLMRQFFSTLPKDLDESAVIDGASYFRIYWNILLPLCKPIIMALGISYFIGNWNSYLWPLLLINEQSKQVIQITIVGFSEEHKTAWDMIFAASAIASIPIFLLFSYFQSYLVEGIKTSGMKS